MRSCAVATRSVDDDDEEDCWVCGIDDDGDVDECVCESGSVFGRRGFVLWSSVLRFESSMFRMSLWEGSRREASMLVGSICSELLFSA